MSQEQAPPEAHESLPHPSVMGEELRMGCGAALGRAAPSSPTQINLSVPQLPNAPGTWARDCQAGLELVAQAQQPELTPGQHGEC